MPQKNWFGPQKWPFLALESSIKNWAPDEIFWNLAKRSPVWVPKSVPNFKKIRPRGPTASKKPHFCLNKELSPLGKGSQSWGLTHSVCSYLTALRWTWGCALHGLMVPRMASGVEGGTTVAEQVEYNNFLRGHIAYSGKSGILDCSLGSIRQLLGFWHEVRYP